MHNAYVAVFFGAGIGGVLRHTVNQLALRFAGPDLPIGTLAVNVIGSVIAGILVGYFALRADPGQNVRLFIVTGILGGFTTFSAFSLDVALLLERGQISAGLGYAIASIVLAVGGVFTGLVAARGVF